MLSYEDYSSLVGYFNNPQIPLYDGLFFIFVQAAFQAAASEGTGENSSFEHITRYYSGLDHHDELKKQRLFFQGFFEHKDFSDELKKRVLEAYKQKLQEAKYEPRQVKSQLTRKNEKSISEVTKQLKELVAIRERLEELAPELEVANYLEKSGWQTSKSTEAINSATSTESSDGIDLTPFYQEANEKLFNHYTQDRGNGTVINLDVCQIEEQNKWSKLSVKHIQSLEVLLNAINKTGTDQQARLLETFFLGKYGSPLHFSEVPAKNDVFNNVIENYITNKVLKQFEKYLTERNSRWSYWLKDKIVDNRHKTDSKIQRNAKAEDFSELKPSGNIFERLLIKIIAIDEVILQCSAEPNEQNHTSSLARQSKFIETAFTVEHELLNIICKSKSDKYLQAKKTVINTNQMWIHNKLQHYIHHISGYSRKALYDTFRSESDPDSVSSRKKMAETIQKINTGFKDDPSKKNLFCLFNQLNSVCEKISEKGSHLHLLAEDISINLFENYIIDKDNCFQFKFTPAELSWLVTKLPKKTITSVAGLKDSLRRQCRLESQQDSYKPWRETNELAQQSPYSQTIYTLESTYFGAPDQFSLEDAHVLLHAKSMDFITNNKELKLCYDEIKQKISINILANKVAQSGLFVREQGSLGTGATLLGSLTSLCPDPTVRAGLYATAMVAQKVEQAEQAQSADNIGGLADNINDIDDIARLFAYLVVMKYHIAISELSTESIKVFAGKVADDVNKLAGKNHASASGFDHVYNIVDQLANQSGSYLSFFNATENLSTKTSVVIPRASSHHILTSPKVCAFINGKLWIQTFPTRSKDDSNNWKYRYATTGEQKIMAASNDCKEAISNNDLSTAYQWVKMTPPKSTTNSTTTNIFQVIHELENKPRHQANVFNRNN